MTKNSTLNYAPVVVSYKYDMNHHPKYRDFIFHVPLEQRFNTTWPATLHSLLAFNNRLRLRLCLRLNISI